MVLPLLTRIDHVGIACRDLDRAIDLYRTTFGLEVVSLEVNQEQGVREAMLAVGPGAGPAVAGPAVAGERPGYIQLLEPLAPDTPVGKFLDRRGEGIHHIGYGVSDIGEALAAIGGTSGSSGSSRGSGGSRGPGGSGVGIRLIDKRPRHGSMGASIAFLHPADLGGVLTELVQFVSPALCGILTLTGFTRTHRIENSEGSAKPPK
jgi:methylmalonyl-CoA/ethylmalonyl-CoA epimerase